MSGRGRMIGRVLGVLAVAVLGVGAAQAQDEAAPRSASGQSLVVPGADASKGTVYHALPGRTRQIYFESNAPLEKIKGQSNQAVGYAVVDGSGRLVAGQWRLAVRSLKTGIELRDEHLAGADWLDAKSHPDIIVRLERFEDGRVVKRTDAFTTYEGVFVGTLTLHGQTRPIRLERTRYTIMPASEKTRAVAQGDLLAIRAKMRVTLSEFGVSHPVIGQKVADTVSIDVNLVHSTVPPERQGAR